MDYMWQAINTFGLVLLGIIAIYNNRQTRQNGESAKEIKVAVDGRLSQLIELTQKSSHAEGMEQQRKDDIKS